MSDTNYESATPEEELPLDTTAAAKEPEVVETPAEPAVEAEPKTRREQLQDAFKAVKEQSPAASTTAPTAAPEGTPATPVAAATKAPQSWSPALREKFSTLPSEVQQQISQREDQMTRKLNETAQERKIAQEFLSVTQPYVDHFKELNVHPLKATQDLLQVGYTLHKGNLQEKVGVVANLIKNFKIDVNALADELDKETPAIPREIDQRLARIEQTYNQQRQQEDTSRINEVNKTIEDFADNPKNKYFDRLATQMSRLIDAGAAKDLQAAYEQAAWADPEIRREMQAEEQANKQRLAAGNASLNNSGPRKPITTVPLNANAADRREFIASLLRNNNGRV